MLAPCITANVAIADKSNQGVLDGTARGHSWAMPSPRDIDLDFRVDAVYVGSIVCAVASPTVVLNNVSPCLATGPTWKGKMYRLTTNNGNPDPDTWGVANAPTVLVSTFTSAGTSPCIGSLCTWVPITSSAQVTSDEQHNIWVFFGSGRYFGNIDKTERRPPILPRGRGLHYDGDMCPSPSQRLARRQNLFDVSNVVVCDITLVGCAGSSQNVSLSGGTAA